MADTSSAGTAAPKRESEFSARNLKPIVDDLFEPNPTIYWADLIISSAITYGSTVLYLASEPVSLTAFLAFFLAGIGFFRIATFMHELVHLRKGQMRLFKIAWNILAGIPLLTPSLFYTTHSDHHSNRYYGTPADGEYLPFGASPPREIIRFIATVPLVPILAVVRALVLVPCSLVIPKFRRWLLTYASAAVISPTYRRRQIPSNTDSYWLLSDCACFLYAALVTTLVTIGSIPLVIIGKLYCVIVFALSLNWIRTLAAHRYRNTGEEVDHRAQVLDSINIEGNPVVTEILYPVGLRYHALHHMLPAIPYHSLGVAHRRIMAKISDDSPYQQTNVKGTAAAIGQLWRDAKNSGANGAAVIQSWREA